MQGSGCGLTEVLSQHFPRRTKENYKKTSSGKLMSWLRFLNELRALLLCQPAEFKQTILVHCILGHSGDKRHETHSHTVLHAVHFVNC
jgi:hypothetical protein